MIVAEYLARCVRGMEWVLTAEISALLDGDVRAVSHREVLFRASLKPGSAVGTADDIFIVVGRIEGVSHTRDALRMLSAQVQSLPVREALEKVAVLRRRPLGKTIEVIASFLGKRNYGRYEIEDAIGPPLAKKLLCTYVGHGPGTRQADISWRIHIRDQQAIIGVRLAPRPLHRREWRIASRPGSLHPPVAFGMAMLADLGPGMLCVDPFCGAGTMLIEAQLLQPHMRFIGADIDFKAIELARANLGRAKVAAEWIVADAGCMPFLDGIFDRVIANPPWGRAVTGLGRLRSSRDSFIAEIQRTLAADSLAVLLIADDEQQGDPGLFDRAWLQRSFKIRVAGRLARMSIFKSPRFQPSRRKLALALEESWNRYGTV